MKRLLMVGLAIGAIGLGYAAYGQILTQIVQGSLTGNEAWQVGQGPGGPGFYTNLAAVRNGTIYASIATGGTITTTISPNVGRVIVTGAVTTLNLSLPTNPYDQQTVSISCPGGTVSTLSVSSPTINGVTNGQTPSGLTAFTTCVANGASGSALYTFLSATSAPPSGAWFRIQ